MVKNCCHQSCSPFSSLPFLAVLPWVPGSQKMNCKGSGLSLWQLEQEEREDVENTGKMGELN